MLDLLDASFNYTTKEDKAAINNAYNHGQALFVIGYGNNVAYHNVVAVVLYVMCEEGTYVNWLAVTQDNYSNKVYGKHASGMPFRGMGLATFLLHMIQLQAVSKKISTDIYLQSNISSQAFK